MVLTSRYLHHYDPLFAAFTILFIMGTLSQWSAWLLNPHHPSVKMIASCCPVTTHARFTGSMCQYNQLQSRNQSKLDNGAVPRIKDLPSPFGPRLILRHSAVWLGELVECEYLTIDKQNMQLMRDEIGREGCGC